MTEYQNKKCKWCSELFKPKRIDSYFCSPQCKRKDYASKNKEKIKIRRARYYQKNIEKERANCKKWYQKNRESEIAKNKEYRKQNKELFDWYHDKNRFDGVRSMILKRDGYKCSVCFLENKLSVHHIDGSGYASLKKLQKSNNDINNLITLCQSCHHKLHWWQRKNYQLTNKEDIVRTMMKVIDVDSKSLR